VALARVQAISGLAFAFFLTLHLATTISGVAGPAVYDDVLTTLRRVYRPTLALELALVGTPAVVHVGCAIAQIVRRRRRGWAARTPLAHRVAGYVLLAAIGGHVYATRIVPALGNDPADYAYLAYSLLNWPLFMRPYYVLLAAAGATHLVFGTAIALRILGRRGSPRRPVAFAAGVAAGLGVAGAIGIAWYASDASRVRFAEYRALYERYVPLLPPRL